ncbi:uncharacterized protein LOC132914368 [Bombus pascuorum]|uniref:uncharacterized protein LOC132913862 n=1 Tax=Bombus pascuorum TaxID=65598 RepID=UPI00298D68D0|nr:uncharacterized protein LOC132913862 [Bombus pascuorum]XP_060828459.1 uncharacterized protein LOC132913865 [Bombus pascuorum]XP_060828460.1 uncharacterized protein LOC132913867 [Bombus pascuorum]XP_060828863.1 uncharacterized protein LOC132914075 [Bombus pascuorum]XP_060829414.1 uncharacterized protein LOC132914367 [Bombus pascuorum]XP_060829415.1 uncharacterized protein LOC132914368 [Bombus pascuorum]
MKNNSDESDYENGSFKNFLQDNDGSVETKETYSSYFSCSNDSDGNEDYYNESTSEKDNIAIFKSHNVYQDFSYEQDSADEGCSRSMQNHVYVQDLSNCNGGLETRTKRKTYEENPYHHSKRQKIHRSSSKSDEEDIHEKIVHNTGKEVITQESKNAAVKMANIDRACNFMFTKPEGLRDNELLYFADVCAGPGGLSKYVL